MAEEKEEQPEPKEEKQERTRIEISETDAWKYNPDYHRFADWLGLEGFNPKTGESWKKNPDIAEKVNLLYEWGMKHSGSEDRVNITMAIKELKKHLGLNMEGKKLVKRLWKWIRLDMDRQRIEKEMSTLEK